jgi:eukaryotic-like serine/threonine-protein kinase
VLGHLNDELIARALAGALSVDEQTAALEHTTECPTCRARLAQTARAAPGGEATLSLGGSPEPREPWSDPPRVGRYLMLDKLGAGGMGAVYSAYDPELDRRIAVKVLNPVSEGRHYTLGQTRLLREAQAMARLAHPNVIAVYDVGTVGDRVFFAMERVDGGTLRDWLAEPRTWREVVAVFVQAGRGLAAAHAAGIVHRDFKPENVLIGKDGRVRVTDFGVARAMEAAAEPAGPEPRALRALETPLTGLGQVVGTPGYMAPEQLEGNVTALSDQFGFCVALYEALAGQRPFVQTPFEAHVRELLNKRVEFPATARAPGFVREVVLRGLQKDPARRFPSMDALLAALALDPTARRIRLAALTALAAAAGVAGGWGLLAHTRKERTCAEAARRASASWERSRPVIAAAFRGAGQAYALDVLRAVEAGFQKFTQAWGQARGAVCRGTAPLPAEQWPASAACLDQASQVMDQAAELLSRGDREVVQHAAQLVGALPSVQDCVDPEALRSAPPPPREPAAAAAVAALQARLARVQVVGIPRPRQTVEAIRAMRPELERLADVPTLARAHFVLGEAEAQANLSSAEPSLQRAAELALAGRDDRLFVRAASRLAHTIGRFPEQRGRARDWMALARQVHERAGKPAALTSWLDLMQVGVHAGAGEWEACIEAGPRAVASARRQGNPFQEVEAAYTLAYCREHSSSPEEALAAYEAALARYIAVLGPEHPETTNAIGSVMDARWMSGDVAGAFKLSEQRLPANRALGPTLQLASALEGHAALLSELGRHEEALAHRREAMEILNRNPHRTISRINVTAGFAVNERMLGRRPQAFAHATEAVAACTEEVARSFAEVCGNARFIMAQLLFDQGKRGPAARMAASARDGFARRPMTRRRREQVEAWARQVGLSLPPPDTG